MKAFKNANVYVEGKGIIKTNLCFNEKILSTAEILGDCEIIDIPQDSVVLPGFIDQHIHGAGGCDVMDGSVTAISQIANTVKKEGTTSFLATTMTQSKQNINKALKSVKEYVALNKEDEAGLLGVHLEGPFISEKYKGAQPFEYIQKPSIELFDAYNKESGNNIKIVSLAPEEEGAMELIKHLSNNKIVASIGHSSCTHQDVLHALENGASNVTHTFNAQTSLHHREIGVVGSALLLDELYSEVICDTIHVSVPALKLLAKCKPNDKLILITDAMRAKGLSDGVSELGGQTVYVKNGEARLENGTLAGSVLTMNLAIKNMVEKVGVPLEQAVDYATINSAKQLKIDNIVGSIKEGKNADFAVLDSNFNVLYTIRNGNVIYQK